MSGKSSPASVLASLGSQTFPTPDVESLKQTERAFKWTLTIDSSLTPKWSCSVVVVQIEDKPFAKGSCRTAHKLKDLTNPAHPFVAKFSTKNASRDQYFVDVLMQTFCSKWSDLYNSFNAPKKITFLPSFVLELVDRPTPVVCGGEPFIDGDYKKFNNNSGYVNSEAARNTPQAFSHFSLVHSNQELVIIDIQGVNDFYTDPQIHTKSGKGFGEGNLGANGIHQFVKTHQCNPLCNFLKLEALNSSKRMLLRGTLPVVQLELDKNSQTAIIRGDADDGDKKAHKQAPPRPARPHREASPDSPAQHPLQPVPVANQPAASATWQPAVTSASSQNPLQPISPTSESAPNGLAGVAAASHAHDAKDGADVVAAISRSASAEVVASPPVEAKWDLKGFKLIDTVRGTQAECICSDEKNVYTGSGDGSISVWDPVELKHVSSFKQSHAKAVKSIILRDSTATLYSAGADAVIKEWDLPTQKVTNEMKDKGEVNAVFLSDNMLFSGSNDKTVKIYDTRSLTCTATLASHTRAVKCLYVLGNYLFSGSNDQQVLVWSLQTNSVLTNLQGHEGWIKSLVGSGSTLYSGSHDETIRVWDLNTLQCQHTLKAKDKVEALLSTPQALFSASGDYLEIWDSKTYAPAASTNARTSVLCLARHGPRVFCGSIGNHLKVWSCEPTPQ